MAEGSGQSVRREAILGGPFRGFDGDTASWFKGQGGVLQDCENVDFLKGQIISRPGIQMLATEATLFAIAVYDQGGLVVDSSSYCQGLSVKPGANCFTWNEYNYFRNTSLLPSFPAATSYMVPSKRGHAIHTDYQVGSGVNIALCGVLAGSKEVKNNYSSTLTDTQKANFDQLFLPGSYIRFPAPNAENLLIVSQYGQMQKYGNTASVWSSANAANTHSDSEYYIIPPLRGVDGRTFLVWDGVNGSSSSVALGLDLSSYSTCTRIPGTNQFYMGGWFGGAFLDFDSPSSGVSFGQTDTSQTRYAARASVYFNNRLLLGTPYSVSCVPSDTGNPTYMKWRLNARHGGRIAYSASGTPRDFGGLGSGVFDVDLGDVYDLFVLRDTCYATCQNGLASIQKTGNSARPFRMQTVLVSDEFLPAKAVVAESAYAVIQTTRGPMKFDGASLQPLGEGMREAFRTVSAVEAATFDFTRGRVAVTAKPVSSSARYQYFIGTDDPLLTRYTYGALTAQVFDMAHWHDCDSSGVTAEMVLVKGGSSAATRGIAEVRRDLFVDFGTTGITISAVSPILDANSSRYNKSCDRVRVTYEDRAVATTKTSTTASRTANVATINFGSAHGFYSGQTVVVSGLTGGFAVLNGTFVVDSVPSTTSITYASTGADIVNAAAVGTVTSQHLLAVSISTDGGITWTAATPKDISGAGTNKVRNADLTFPPVTGQQWCVKVSATAFQKLVVNQVALYFVDRAEAKAF